MLERVLDHGNGLDARETAVLGKPFDIVADNVAARFDAAVICIDGLEGLQFRGRGIVEIAFDVVMQGGLVILDGQQVVGTPFEDGGGDLGLAPHGVDGDQRALQFKPLDQQRDGGDLVGFDVCRFLPEDEPLA